MDGRGAFGGENASQLAAGARSGGRAQWIERNGGSALLLPVHRLRIKGAFVVHKLEGGGISGNNLTVETGAASGVAGARALLVHIEEESILITVGADLLENLRVPVVCKIRFLISA